MVLNPIVFTEKVVRSFLRYQLTAYPFADERLHGQMRRLLSLDETRQSPLLKGPYVSLSRSFRRGVSVKALIADGIFHPFMLQRIPGGITHVYGHQVEAEDGTWRHVKITLRPVNTEYDAIELTSDDEDRLQVVAELVEVLGVKTRRERG